ncbi:30S ribosome-binding factor RbfA [Gilvimarinus japonicus]|jgi:ribosome-binding factor A|uniref:Ribosome-binding factor A n=1 Tax=Gilvimarinus japonicus TaxID=1796469 RepID=A0ABV7HUE6_9GAMM
MPREFTRSDRVGDAIQRYLANMIQQEVRDPRVGMVNINDVKVTRDMAYAKVYVTLVGADEDESRTSVSVLNKASGFLRTMLAKELNMRTVPKLQFYYDHTSVRGQELSSLIDRAVAADKAKSDDESE